MRNDYEILTVEEIPRYIAAHESLSAIVSPGHIESIEEVGDGNLNLVFIVRPQDGAGIVLKQALPYVRLVGPDWPMTPERARIEARTTELHAGVAHELVPQIYEFDAERYIIAMEDLSDHVVWRTALNKGLDIPGVAAELGRYVARVAFGTSIFAIDTEELALRKERAHNPDLCSITEDLVFTEPYYSAERNSYLPANDSDVTLIASDEFLKTEMAGAKWVFMTSGEALIHGDLHTGSVMVRADASGDAESVKAFDSEFAFYGPVAFDLGALWANYCLAAARAYALGEDARALACLTYAEQTWQAFESEFRSLWPKRTDKRIFSDTFLDNLLGKWLEQTWLFASAKMIRRIIGLAKASDIETLDPTVREGAARGILQLGQAAVRARISETRPSEFVAIAQKTLTATRTN